mgnify:CR=1 FL=1
MKKDLGLYIHIPFCVKKCEYCDFLSWNAEEEERQQYVAALLSEIESYREFAKGYRVSTIFIGGGTPSVLLPKQMEDILQKIYEIFELERRAEITIEVNPGTVDEEKLQCYKENGVNRLSMGLQSVKDEKLRLLGRIHTYQEFVESYELARKAGFDNISIDLISSVPGQTLQEWKEEQQRKIRSIFLYISLLLKRERLFMKNMQNIRSFCLMRRPAEKSIFGQANF